MGKLKKTPRQLFQARQMIQEGSLLNPDLTE